jgi:GR25 family glycosyltransferase involved in LPS biosynthesis
MRLDINDVPMVCISLDRRTDRWETFRESASAARLQVKRFSAVDARGFEGGGIRHPDVSILTAHNLKYGKRRSHYEIDKIGAVGCSLSHFACWKALLASQAPAMIVFEDDIALPQDLRDRLVMMIRRLPTDWDLVSFHRTGFAGGTYDCQPVKGEGEWQSCESLMGTHGYMVSREGARRLLEKAYPIELHVDAYIAFMARLGYIQMLWHPLIDIKAPDGNDTDIDHGSEEILNLPANPSEHGLMILDNWEIFGIVFMAAIAGGIISLAYGSRK